MTDAASDQDSGRYRPIADYALLGNSRASALVSSGGSVDWLCMPQFDSSPHFARILDFDKGGCFAIRPREPARVTRRYLPDTNILETTFSTPSGDLRLTDLFVVTDERAKQRLLWPDHEFLRVAECIRGELALDVQFDPRIGYGLRSPRIEQRGRFVHIVCAGLQTMALHTDCALSPSSGGRGLRAAPHMKAGDRLSFSMTLTDMCPQFLMPLGAHAEERIEMTRAFWREWTDVIGFEGPYRSHVVRSALVLKLLTFAPSGAIVAAPTTSLPEEIGGERNWDYRYCWLRDASMTLRAFLNVGHEAEGRAFLSWMLHATRRHQPRLRVLFDVYGGQRIRERRLDWLDGYRGSRPVRTGNGAARQLQFDIYGTVVDACYEFVMRGGRLSRESQRLMTRIATFVCRHWREPDEGIWELRSEPRQHTLSKAMCWIALDRVVRLHERSAIRKAPVARFRAEMKEIAAAIVSRGYSPKRGSYVDEFDGDTVDASLLLLMLYGFEDPRSERAVATREAVCRGLSVDGLLLRYRADEKQDALRGEEGAFTLCSFWDVQCLARMGRIEEARREFERLLALSNDLGLYSEEVNPRTGLFLGNFPQAYTHIGLINAASDIAMAERGRNGPAADGGSTELAEVSVNQEEPA